MTDIVTGPLREVGTYTMGEDVAIADVHVRFDDVEILHGVSLEIPASRTLALVGESGSGKSTLALTVARLLEPGLATTSGTVRIGETEMLGLSGAALRRARSRVVAYLAQDASVALDPLMRVGSQIAEAYRVRERLGWREARHRALEGLADVGMRDPRQTYRQYPHQLSGGMRQRVMIAIALALRPSLLVADEPTTALDVTVQREILDLVARLQREYGLTVLWITHDFSVVAEIADEVAVMHDGRIVESGPVLRIFDEPQHDYTKSLLRSFAAGRTTSSKAERAQVLTGSIPVASPSAGRGSEETS
jgi:ABC-type dipeptide/oligopeptide/nickel transport system ATPase component